VEKNHPSVIQKSMYRIITARSSLDIFISCYWYS